MRTLDSAPSWWLLLSSLLLLSANAQIQPLNITSKLHPDLSATCIARLNQVVACDSSLMWAGRGRFEDDSTLTTLCTAACSSALTVWHGRVISVCTTRYNNGNGALLLPQVYSEYIIEQYNLVCLQHGGLFCNAVIRNKAGINPVNQKRTASAVATLKCDDCMIKSMSARQQMPLMSDPAIVSVYSSLTASCRKTTFTFTATSSVAWSISATATLSAASTTRSAAPSACVGTSYVIKTGDTCKTISKANGISTESLLRTNDLSPLCAGFPAVGKTLCISTQHKCTTYTVKTGDNCVTIADSFKRTFVQMITWNPELGLACEHISQYPTYEICVTQPGGMWVNPFPDVTTTTTALPGRTGTPLNLLPRPTFGNFGNNTIVKYENGTRLDCQRYITGEQMPVGKTSCAAVAAAYNIKLSDLYLWNPGVTKTAPCVLKNDVNYCVQRLEQIAQGSTEYCSWRSFAGPTQTCEQFIATWGLPLEVFVLFNPFAGATCAGFKTGFQYCVQAEHYKQAGIIATCNQWTMANETSWLRNPCQIIETKYGLTHGRFVAWNPSLTTNCTGIWSGFDYCVSIPGFRPVYTTTSANSMPT